MPNKKAIRTAIPKGRKEEIAGLAEAVADEYFPKGQVGPEAILDAREITLSYGHYDDAFDGMLEHKNGRFHVYCNLDRAERASSPRARFTLAHELGHYFIDEHRNALRSGRTPEHGSFCEYESRNPAEKEADHFASNLLMPEGRFKVAARRYQAGLAGILPLAAQFATSVTSTAIRYATLNIKPCAIIKWSAESYQWKWLSDEARMAKYWKTIESVAAVPPDSSTGRALRGEDIPSPGFFQAGTTAAAWFPSLTHDSYRNVILIEQAVSLGRFGVLTFIYPESGNFPGLTA